MRIALTGADGFTGRHFVRLALAAGHDIAVLDAELTDAAAVRAQVEACEAEVVLHLAGLAFVGHGDTRAFYDVNLFGTLHLLDALVDAPHAPRRVLLASSANVYGNVAGSPISETQCPAPINHYATSKLAMEHMARTYADRLPLTVVRPFNYTGPGQSSKFVIPKLVDHFCRRERVVRLGNLEVHREYNDVRFVCQAYLQLLEANAIPDILNVCTGRTWDLAAVVDKLEAITGHSLRVEVDPSLVRPSEVHQLSGDPARLRAAIGSLHAPSLEETLRWMVSHHA